MDINLKGGTKYLMSTFQKIENKDEWEALLSGVPFKTFFHTIEWESFLEKEFSWMKFERYMWRDKLLLSVARCKLFGKEKIVSHPLCEYGGPLPLADNIDYANFENDFTREFGRRARIHYHPRIKTESAGALSTFWIENYSKKTVEDLWRGLRKTVRQEIGAGERRGIYVENCKNGEELKQFYKMYLDTVKKHKNIPLPFSAFEFFHKSSNADILLAKKDGKVLGGSVFLFYEPFIHYFLNASDYQFRKWNVGHMVLWSAMQKYKNSTGYDYFDLGGTRKGSSLEVFKRGWGAKEYPIYETSPSGSTSRNSRLRDIWGMLPKGAIEKLAPWVIFNKI